MTRNGERTARVAPWPPAQSRLRAIAARAPPLDVLWRRRDADEHQRCSKAADTEPRAREAPRTHLARHRLAPPAEPGALVDRLQPSRPRARGGYVVAAPRTGQVLRHRLVQPGRVLRGADRRADRSGGGGNRSQVARRPNAGAD